MDVVRLEEDDVGRRSFVVCLLEKKK